MGTKRKKKEKRKGGKKEQRQICLQGVRVKLLVWEKIWMRNNILKSYCFVGFINVYN